MSVRWKGRLLYGTILVRKQKGAETHCKAIGEYFMDIKQEYLEALEHRVAFLQQELEAYKGTIKDMEKIIDDEYSKNEK